jgi:hypothetical protein
MHANVGAGVAIRSVTAPPSSTRTTCAPSASLNQIPPAESSAHPSGAVPAMAAHSRRSARVASSPIVNHRPVGESHLVGGQLDRAVGSYEHEVRHLERCLLLEVESEVADVRIAVSVDHHVVAVPGRDRRQVGVLDQRTVTRAAHQLALGHEHDEERPVGHPAEPRRTVGEVAVLDPPVTVGADRVDRPLMEVGVPQPSVVPARPLGEIDAVDQQFPCHGRDRNA